MVSVTPFEAALMKSPEYEVQFDDVSKVPSDLLLLKHAQAFYSADRAVASSLISLRLCVEDDLRPQPGEYVLVETNGLIAPSRVMFLGTPSLSEFGYEQMELFAQRAIQAFVKLGLPLNVMTTTVHGSGYGLDGGESLQRLVRGFQRGLSETSSIEIGKIMFVTMGEREARILTAVLANMSLPPRNQVPPPNIHEATSDSKQIERSGSVSNTTGARATDQGVREASVPGKKRVFVAMPFTDEFDNVYEFGIYPAVRNCGFICEKVDEAHFTGDVLARIKQGIETAAVVIADLTQARPNVYLEVGYAWGRGTRVIFLARRGEDLHFDVRMHRCIYYGKFAQLSKDLEELLRGLEASGEI